MENTSEPKGVFQGLCPKCGKPFLERNVVEIVEGKPVAIYVHSWQTFMGVRVHARRCTVKEWKGSLTP